MRSGGGLGVAGIARPAYHTWIWHTVDVKTLPRAVLLDAGNTLICLDLPEIGRLLTAAGAAVTAEELQRAEYHGRRAVNAMVAGPQKGTDRSRAFIYFSSILTGAGIAEKEIPALFDLIRDANDRVGLWRVVPAGARDALERFKHRGVKLGVVSNADGRVAAQLEAARLADLLDFVIDSHRVGVEKPDPRIFQMGLERAGVQPAEAVYVGDLYAIDVMGARGAGVDGVLVDPLMLETVDCPRVRSIAELPALYSL